MTSLVDQRPVAVVSGGSRGLGLALVRDFLNRGYRVETFSRTESAELAGLRAADDSGALFWSAVDGTDADAIQAFTGAVVRRHRRIDVLVNNAAVGLEGLLTLTSPAAIDAALRTNLTLPILLARACLKPMLARRDGVVVNLSSINALRGQTGVAVYGAAKAALDGLTRGLAREVGPAGIRVVSVAPGYFDSDMTAGIGPDQRRRIERRTPLGRLGSVEDVLGVVRFLTSPAASFITGQTITVDGGYTC
ncbi:SDR family NAD(P)-dependent oxidoreductase [Actinoplanes derwentensis]|uniref:3-oxoacyl-[acyl-carrier protein] reductase n=1 Tax=Actinoplanes derwentensis TaxID=113562 RepID=A0A1H2CII9_9ACTN|nr:SDR family oxidoreductase [Actinoplanes derwentensis]GID89591.1 beta-ketoacyl-ACP reductase [Actinoplanes derwentensis]SDT70154.1 3-oxoacyl-[acyl-carrier protein] reductase [Actinoplanes derwentensis]